MSALISRSQKVSLILLLALAIAIFAIVENYQTMTPVQNVAQKFRTVEVGKTSLQAEVVDTPGARTRGLSGRSSLPPGEGMLFVFEQEDAWGFWMKDMQFSLDIIWANKEGTIVTIKTNLTPETYPKAFYPDSPALFVLEVPSGFVKAHGIAEGMKIVVK